MHKLVTVLPLIFALLSVSLARAEMILDVTQIGPNVVVVGSGSVNLAGLSYDVDTAWTRASIDRQMVQAGVGAVDMYNGFTGPDNFGSSTGFGGLLASSGSGDPLGVGIVQNRIYLPRFYVSGSALSGTSTYDNTSLATLNMAPGLYQFTWNTSPTTTDRVTVNVSIAAVPEPSSLLMVAISGTGFWCARRRISSRHLFATTVRPNASIG